MTLLNAVMKKKILIVTICACLLTLVVAGQIVSCGAGYEGSGTPIVILSPHWEGIVKEFSWGFSKWMKDKHGQDVYVDTLDVGGGTGTILRYIESEFHASPESIGVDIIFGGGDSAHQSLAEKGFLQPVHLPRRVSSGLAKHIGGQPLHDPSGLWYGTAMSSFGIISNQRIIETVRLPQIEEWSDLTSPRVFGWVASGDPSSSGSVRMVFEVILQAYGFEKGYRTVTQISGNIAAFDEGGNSAPRSVALGQSAYGLCIDFYGWEQVAACGADNVSFLLPKDLTVITPDPIAMIRGAPHPDLARKFMEYVLSEDGQKLWYVKVGAEGGPKKYGLNRLPVMQRLYDSKLPTGVTMNPFEWGSSLAFDSDLASKRRQILGDLARATWIDVHAELRSAWKAIIDAGEVDHPELVEEFSCPPVSGEELLRLAEEEWPDPSLHADRMLQWANFARKKYRTVRLKALALIE